MKKQQVCALLCVAAMSATSVTPVMAADAALPEETVAVQSETEAAGEAEAVQEEAPEASEEAGAVQSETEAAGEAEAAGEVQEEEQQQTAEDLNDAGTTIQDGWSVDEDGNTCYYKDGVKLTGQVAEIADEDGTVYGYYFENDGALFTNGTQWISIYDEEQQYWHQECFIL